MAEEGPILIDVEIELHQIGTGQLGPLESGNRILGSSHGEAAMSHDDRAIGLHQLQRASISGLSFKRGEIECGRESRCG